MLVFLLAFILKCDDNETDKDIDHEEGYDDYVDNEINGNVWPVIKYWAMIFPAGVDGFIGQAKLIN
jgi:hypothetical protein